MQHVSKHIYDVRRIYRFSSNELLADTIGPTARPLSLLCPWLYTKYSNNPEQIFRVQAKTKCYNTISPGITKTCDDNRTFKSVATTRLLRMKHKIKEKNCDLEKPVSLSQNDLVGNWYNFHVENMRNERLRTMIIILELCVKYNYDTVRHKLTFTWKILAKNLGLKPDQKLQNCSFVWYQMSWFHQTYHQKHLSIYFYPIIYILKHINSVEFGSKNAAAQKLNEARTKTNMKHRARFSSSWASKSECDTVGFMLNVSITGKSITSHW